MNARSNPFVASNIEDAVILTYRYFSIPLLFKYSTEETYTKNSFFIGAGPYFNFLIKANYDASYLLMDLNKHASDLEFGLAIATGLNLCLKEKIRLFVGLRNHLILSSIDEIFGGRTYSFGILLG